MTRTGFKRTYAAGTLDSAAVQTLFDDIKAALIATGFTQVINTATEIDVLRAGYPAGTVNDDVPHWAFSFESFSPTSARIQCWAVHGNDYLTGTTTYSVNLININSLPDPAVEVSVWFACDGYEGWWWLVCITPQPANNSGYQLDFAHCGCTSRRYLTDNYQGLSARYGIWDGYGDWNVPYAKDETGAVVADVTLYVWSPLGMQWSNNGIRHPGSPMQKMALPQFPARDTGITVAIFGELNETLSITDGYTLEESPIAGWIAFPVGNNWTQPFALPAPEQFAVVP